jgi:hypothetical protein
MTGRRTSPRCAARSCPDCGIIPVSGRNPEQNDRPACGQAKPTAKPLFLGQRKASTRRCFGSGASTFDRGANRPASDSARAGAKPQRAQRDASGWLRAAENTLRRRWRIIGDRLPRYAGRQYIVPPRRRGGHAATPDSGGTARDPEPANIIHRRTRLPGTTASTPSSRVEALAGATSNSLATGSATRHGCRGGQTSIGRGARRHRRG